MSSSSTSSSDSASQADSWIDNVRGAEERTERRKEGRGTKEGEESGEQQEKSRGEKRRGESTAEQRCWFFFHVLMFIFFVCFCFQYEGLVVERATKRIEGGTVESLVSRLADIYTQGKSNSKIKETEKEKEERVEEGGREWRGRQERRKK